MPEMHQLLQGTISPRPIAFVSSVDSSGNVNLSPFSFFNMFSSNPPILIFSPSRRVRDNTTKHTLQNVQEVPQVTISVVSYDMVEQMSLASTEYEKGVNEYVKSGFTEEPSLMVKPPYVKESLASYECEVIEIKPLGDQGGSGTLVICKVLLAHVSEAIYTNGKIDPDKTDLVARMGGDWYCRTSGASAFEVEKPLQKKGVGFDHIPVSIRHSKVLTGNQLGRLGNVEILPTQEEIDQFATEPEVSAILEAPELDEEHLQEELHKLAAQHLEAGSVMNAWKVLLQEY